VDRWDRRHTMIVSDLVRACLVLFCLLVTTRDQVWIFYVVGFLMSCTGQFFFPARNALLPLLVPEKQDWLQANGLMQIIQTVGLLAGPALAGFAIGLFGERVAFLVNSSGYIASAIAVIAIRPIQKTAQAGQLPASIQVVWADLRAGLRFMFASRTLVGIILCLSIINLGLGAITVIWVPYLQRTFHVGAAGLGLVDSSQGAGMVASGLVLSLLVTRLSKKNMASGSIILIGLSLAAMGLAPTFGFILLFGFLIGLGLTPAESALNTILQIDVPDSMRGRVGSSLNAFTTSASLLSMTFASGLGDLLNLHTIYLIFGAIVGLSGLLGFWLLKEPEDSPHGVG
jgi:DHA3 family macrolide efflux protein-like MFS transporter